MKKSRILTTLFMSTTLLFSGCGSTPQPEGISIVSEGNVSTLMEEASLQLYATVFPEKAVQTVTWSSADPETATVSESGLVYGVDAGNVLITATSTENTSVSQDFALTVTEKPAEEIAPTSITVTSSGNATSLKVGGNIRLTATVSPEGAPQDVTWSSGDDAVATVSAAGIVQGLQEGTVTITAASKKDATVKGSLTLSVEPADTPDPTVDWSAVDYTTHAEFMECDNDIALKVKGKVSHVAPVSDGKVSYYLQSGTDGYYVYAQNASAFPVELGKTYEVGGFKKYYNGMREIVNVEYLNELDETLDYSVSDISELDVTDADAMAPYHASWVRIASGTVESFPTNWTKAFSVNVKVNGNTIAYRVDPANMTEEAFGQLVAKWQSVPSGAAVEVVGIMSAFGYGKPSNQLQIMSADDISVAQLSPTALLEAAAGTIVLPNSVLPEQSSINLPTSLSGYDGVTISWISDNAAVSSSGAVVHPSDTLDVTLTAVLQYQDAEVRKPFTITVFGSDESKLTAVHTLDFEDALPATESSYNCSATKPSYNVGDNTITLGTPAAKWLLRNALIGGDQNDRKNGTFSIRTQQNKVQDSSGRVELCQDMTFNMLEFKSAVYGTNALGIKLMVSYSSDSGTTWTTLDRLYTISSTELETIRVLLPLSGAGRAAITVVSNTGQRVNIDDIRLIEAA